MRDELESDGERRHRAMTAKIDWTKIDAIQASRVVMRGRMTRAMCYHAVMESRNRIA